MATKRMAEGGLVDAGLSAVSRFLRTLPETAKEWPKQAWDMVRLPADLVYGGTPEEQDLSKARNELAYKAVLRGDTRPSLQALPERTAEQRYRPGTPEARAHQVSSFVNPLANAVFAPKQSLALANSPVGRATLGGLGALMLGVDPMSAAGAAGVIKQRGGNWLDQDVSRATGRYLSDAPKELVPTTGQVDLARYPFMDPNIGELFTPEQAASIKKQQALNKWIEGPLTKYIKRDMATPEDPLRRLAEQGILPTRPGDINYNLEAYGKYPHPGQEFMAQAPEAKLWEGAADNAIGNTDASYFQRTGVQTDLYPWLRNLEPDTPIHSLSEPRHTLEDTGLNHVIYNLGRELEAGNIRPEQLTSGNISVEAAVRMAHEARTAEEARKVAKQLAQSRNTAVQVHKEYPDSPEGFHWVQIRKPENEGELTSVPRTDPHDLPDDVYRELQERADQDVIDMVGGPADLGEEEFEDRVREHFIGLAEDWVDTHPKPTSTAMKSLQDALEYEGDQMGHCVGGYCNPVAAGTTQIFSLRDKTGKPHVTIETSNGKQHLKKSIYTNDSLPELFDAKHGEGAFSDLIHGDGHHSLTWKELKDLRANTDDDHDVVRWLLDKGHDDLLDPSWLTPPERKIKQIKGSGKKDPSQAITPEDAPKLQPFIQDFLKGGKWEEIQDLKNAGMMDLGSAYDFNRLGIPPTNREIQAKFLGDLQARMDAGEKYMPKTELQSLYEQYFGPDAGPVYAKGGLVMGPEDYLDRLGIVRGPR